LAALSPTIRNRIDGHLVASTGTPIEIDVTTNDFQDPTDGVLRNPAESLNRQILILISWELFC